MLRRVVALLGLRIGKETTVARRTSGRLIVGIAVSASRRSRGWAVVIIAIVKGLVGTAGLGRWRVGGGLEQTLVTEKNKKKQALKVVNYEYRAKKISGNSTYLIRHGDWGLRCRKLVMLEIKEEAIFKREKKE